MTKKLIEVTEPVATVRHNRHVRTLIYVLPDDKHWFQMPGGKTGKRVGPCLLVREQSPVADKVFKRSLVDPETWGWIGDYLNVAQWALNDKRVAPHLPLEYVGLSPRFVNTSQEQRRRMRDKLPFSFRKRKTKM